jgi:DNA-binding GntR family transcriptional regulator
MLMHERLEELPLLSRGNGLRSTVATQLMLSMFTGQLKAGDRLVVNRVANQMGVSATPVREALVELENLGLLETLPNRGASCLPFGPRELHEIYHLRGVLETEATRMACGKVPNIQVSNLLDQCRELLHETDTSGTWSAKVIEVDIALHSLVVEHCGSGRLRHEIDRYAEMMRTVREVIGNRLNLQRLALEDHTKILECLRKNDASAAAEAMTDHINHTRKNVIPLVFRDEERT